MVRRHALSFSLSKKESITNDIHDAWGFVYDLDNELPNFYLTDEKGTFWLSRKGKLYQKNNAPFVDHILNHKLFKLKQVKYKNMIDVTLTIEPTDMECFVDGRRLTKKTEIKNGQCEIASEKFDLRLKFEAFLDATDYPELARIGSKYRYINLIGMGGFANVYKGLNVYDETFYAIKTARHHSLDPELVREEFLLSKLKHSNIIRVMDWIKKGRDEFLITELATGGSLDYRMKNGEEISEAFAKRIFTQVFSAFAYLHPKKIIHRDMKPTNIVLMRPDDYCIVKVIDFGLSCYISEAGEMEYIVGSYEYMAPEILTKKLKKPKTPYTAKTDIWGIGVCLFMALTNCLPFPYDVNLRKYRKAMMLGKDNFIELERYKTLSKGTKFILENCLQVSEGRRPTIANLAKYPWLLAADTNSSKIAARSISRDSVSVNQ